MKILHVAGREVAALLGSAVGWLILTAFNLIGGLVFFLAMLGYSQSSEHLVASPYAGVTLSFTDHLLAPYFNFQVLFLLFMLPGVTMRLISEEVRQRTIELLETSPLSIWEIVLGKYLGAMGFVTAMLALSCWAPASLMWWGDPDPIVVLCGMAAVWLASACIVALGLAASAATAHQVLALVLSLGFALGLLLVSGLQDFDPTGILPQLAIAPHLEDLMRGVLRASDFAYFIAFIGFFLLATHQRLALRRWA
jgi:ABC-2 type transport system permease protein